MLGRRTVWEAPAYWRRGRVERVTAELFKMCTGKYEGHVGRLALVRMLRCIASTHEMDGRNHLWSVILRLDNCGLIPCGRMVCPACIQRLQSRESFTILKHIVARSEVIPDPQNISFITVNDANISDMQDLNAIRATCKRFKQKLRDVRRRHLGTTAWAGHLELSLAGKWHYHALVLHAECQTQQLLSVLRSSFGAGTNIFRSPWQNDESILTSIVGTARYLAKGRPKLRANGDDYGSLSENALQLAHWVAAWDQLGYATYVGSRLYMNMRTKWRWRDNTLLNPRTGESREFPEMTSLQASRRNGGGRARTLLGSPWIRSD